MESVKHAITRTLAKQFPTVSIYDETLRQGFTEPCFFVMLLNSAQQHEVDRRRKRHLHYLVRYFPSEGMGQRKECEQVATKLYEVLERIESAFHGREMKYEIVDNVLQFTFIINVYLMAAPTKVEKMKQAEVSIYGR